jgi:hypothetical protein
MTFRPLAPILFLLAACSSAGTPTASTDDAGKFVGTWTYQPGSAIVIDCPGALEQTIDLSRTPPAGNPGYFVFSETSSEALHEVDARGCNYDWSVSGGVATAAANQSCATFPDGHGGNLTVQMQSGTKSTSDGASMTVEVHFTTTAPATCDVEVSGVATKS